MNSKSKPSQSNPQSPILEGPVGPTLVKLAIPMTFGILSIVMFNVVDTLYVGHLGSQQLAALSFTFPVVFFVISISIGLSIGLSAVLAKAIGEGNPERVRRLTTHGMLLALLIVLIVALIGLLTMDPVFLAMGAEAQLMPIIKEYMTVWFLGIGMLVIPMVGNGAIRATGDTKTPSWIMVMVGVINIILDPFFIFGIGPFPRLEVTGAALVTVIAWGCSLLVTLWILGKREKMIRIPQAPLRVILQSWKEILHIGGPAILTNMMVPISAGILTRFLAQFGEDPVAAYGVGSRIETIAIIGMLALTSVLTPFIGQNWGAGNHQRVREGTWFSLKFCLVWSLAIYLLIFFLARPLGRAFTGDPEIIQWIQIFLWWVPLTYGGYGISICVNAIFNALHRPLSATLLVILRLFLFTIPLAYLGGRIWGVWGVFLGVGAGNILIGFLSFFWIFRYLNPKPKISLEGAIRQE